MTQIPLQPSATILAKNLAALLRHQPGLHERIHWPVVGDHLNQGEDGTWLYSYRKQARVLDLDDSAVARSLASVDLQSDGELLLFGLGLGEQLAAVCAQKTHGRLFAWERDPWILRQVLALRDWSEPIEAGRLRFALGSDLVELAGHFAEDATVAHPLLSRVYSNEHHLLKDGFSGRRALLCDGTLFVDSVADALRTEGYSVYTFDVERLAVEELDLTVKRLGPDLVFSINLINGLGEFCSAHGIECVVWEVDPATDPIAPLASSASTTCIHTFRQRNRQGFEEAGYAQVDYTPLAADTERRRPMNLDEFELERFGASVSFVGSSLVETAAASRTSFLEQFGQLDPQAQRSPGLGERVIEELLASQRSNLDEFTLPLALESRLPNFRRRCLEHGMQDPAILLGELAASEKRQVYLASLEKFNTDVWGDAGWETLEGIHYRGPALHESEVPRIYNASAINVDVGRLYQDDIVTMRIFDILACGGLVLAERSEALAELFELGVEVESYRGIDELRDKIDYYLAHPEAAELIARSGHQAVVSRHQIIQRIRKMVPAQKETQLTRVSA